VILYRKTPPLRLRRVAAPAVPFWCATTISPYSARRAAPVAIDYVALRASGVDKLEVMVTESVRGDLERTKVLDGPVLIDAAEAAEGIFRRGEEALAYCAEQDVPALFLTSTEGALPQRVPEDTVVAIAAWPLALPALVRLFADARERGLRWGVVVPLLYPVTTDLAALSELAATAREHGASFLASLGLEIEATAKQALATNADDETFAMLFHQNLEPLHTATERHVAALAHAYELADAVLPPRADERSNWNAAILLTRTASRMMAMELDLDLAGTLARSARAIAALDKPITRIAAAANLSIISALDETSAEMLTEWLATGSAEFMEYVDRLWRVRRDYTPPS
jgi:hypothetical protein